MLCLAITLHVSVAFLVILCNEYVDATMGMNTASNKVAETVVIGNHPKAVNAAIACMIKDESLLLPYWIDYHSLLFGIENLVIIDNFSTDKQTIAILQQFEKKGLKVIWKAGPFENQGKLQTSALKRYFPHAHLGIGLDVDEFIVPFIHSNRSVGMNTTVENMLSYRNNQILLNKHLLHDILSLYITNSHQNCWRMIHFYQSISCHVNSTAGNITLFSRDNNIPKAFARLNKLYTFHLGCHYLKLLNTSGHHSLCDSAIITNHHLDVAKYLPSNKVGNADYAVSIGLLHYHFLNPYFTVQRAIDGVKGFNKLPAEATLQNIHQYKDHLSNKSLVTKTDHRGRHKINELLLYIDKGPEALLTCDKKVLVKFDGLDKALETLKKQN